MAITNCAATAAGSSRSATRGPIVTDDGALSSIELGRLEARALLVELGTVPAHDDDPFGPGLWLLRERLQQFLTRRAVPTDAELGFLSEFAAILTQATRDGHVAATPASTPARAAGYDPAYDERIGALAFVELLRAVRKTPEVPMSDAVREAATFRPDEAPGPSAVMYDYVGHIDPAVARCLAVAGQVPTTAAVRGLVKALGSYIAQHELIHVEFDPSEDDDEETEFYLTANGFRDHQASALVGEKEAKDTNAHGLEPSESSGTADEERSGAEAFVAFLGQMKDAGFPLIRRSDRNTGDPDSDLDFNYAAVYEKFIQSYPSPQSPTSPFAQGWLKACAIAMFMATQEWPIEDLEADEILHGIAATGNRQAPEVGATPAGTNARMA